jgi:hypothetical protein
MIKNFLRAINAFLWDFFPKLVHRLTHNDKFNVKQVAAASH